MRRGLGSVATTAVAALYLSDDSSFVAPMLPVMDGRPYRSSIHARIDPILSPASHSDRR